MIAIGIYVRIPMRLSTTLPLQLFDALQPSVALYDSAHSKTHQKQALALSMCSVHRTCATEAIELVEYATRRKKLNAECT